MAKRLRSRLSSQLSFPKKTIKQPDNYYLYLYEHNYVFRNSLAALVNS